MVTVEAAYALAALAAFIVLGLAAIGGIAAHLRCTDAAREVARLAAVGDPEATAVGTRIAPAGARIQVADRGDEVVATITAKVPLLPLLDVSARSIAAVEPEGDDSSTVDR